MFKEIVGFGDLSKEERLLHKTSVREKVNQINYRRGMVLLTLGIILETILILFYDIPNIIESGWMGELGLYYLIFHSIILLISLFGTFRSYRLIQNKAPIFFKKMSFEITAFVIGLLFLVCVGMINAMDQRYSPNTTVYTIYIIIVASMIILEPKYTITMFLVAQTIFIFGMLRFQDDPEILVLNLTNSTIIVICGIVISYIFYLNYYRIHLKSILLEETSKKLEILSNTDPLTKLFNRRYFYDYSSKDDFANKLQGRVIFVLFDLDSFKLINDTYGHIVGDEILVYFSSLLKNECSEGEFAVRWGGEEFLLVLQERTNEEAINITSQILEACTQAYSQTLSHKIMLTASAGISFLEKYSYKEIDMVLSRADKELYKAKANGKNQISIW